MHHVSQRVGRGIHTQLAPDRSCSLSRTQQERSVASYLVEFVRRATQRLGVPRLSEEECEMAIMLCGVCNFAVLGYALFGRVAAKKKGGALPNCQRNVRDNQVRPALSITRRIKPKNNIENATFIRWTISSLFREKTKWHSGLSLQRQGRNLDKEGVARNAREKLESLSHLGKAAWEVSP